MIKRLFDIVFSVAVLALFFPLLLIISIGVKVSDGGPIFYLARRAGLKGKPFNLIKFRTMNVNSDAGSQITGTNDDRVFYIGKLLRKTKLDELPQFLNVLLGEMSVVGPRPEGIDIVNRYYLSHEYKATLDVKPGVASPGSLFNYTHSHLYLDDADPEKSYVENLLPVKLALELVYIKDQNIFYDLNVIFKTVYVIVLMAFGKKIFDFPKEYAVARQDGLIK